MTSQKRTRIAAYGLILNEGQILLCRLSERAKTHNGYWTLPGGGIDFGEDPAAAVVREVFEETGLRVQPTRVCAINSWVAREFAPETHSVQILYHAEVLSGTLTNEVGGTTDLCEWHELEGVRDLPIVQLVELGMSLVSP